MKRNIDVMLGDGVEVGTLRYDQQGRRESAAFEYDAGWLGDPAHFTLGPTLPLQAGPLFHRKSKDGSLFHAAIADTEPDGWGNLHVINARPVPELATAIDQWLAARDTFKNAVN